MSSKYLTVSEVAKYTDIPNATLKRYMQKHSKYVDYKKDGRMYLINIESMEVLQQIRIYYNEGHKSNRIENKIANDGYPHVNKTQSEIGTMTEKEIEIYDLLIIQQEEIDLLKKI